ncbi:hypothetical protein NECAME_13627 [Necator americanus]|uniref:RRM domain-containing protein n=1 Tax=Necator americanus TaxID=51031 RepID=W2SU19_NECAM|nr:hypothetical protein NECAME_13627 [Necator americanus]ETN73135.1 hypothetical protein NECAME_13627 [Necator americanus]
MHSFCVDFSSRSRREHHRSSNGGGADMHRGMSMGMGGGPQRGAGSFSGMAFTESELMGDLPKKKFTGRCRLFVGNLPNEVKESELKELFSPHGDIAECYLSGKGFAFLRMDTRAHAESAKEAIDGRVIHGRQVRVRFAVHGAALRVKELSPTVSNEMLYHAFSHFGEVERAVHIVDEKGRPTGEGIVEFERKPSCNEAVQAIKEKVFLLTATTEDHIRSPKPLVVELLEPRDEDDGLAERMIPRTAQLIKERELGPRFPSQNSFEFVYGMKWKELYAMEKQRKAQLEEELKEARRRLETDMELAYQDYQAQMLREDLQRRQQELERLEAARRERLNMRAASGGPGLPGPGGPNMSMNPPMQPFGQPGPFGQPMPGAPMGAHMGGPPMGGPPMGGHYPPQQFQQAPPGSGGPGGPPGPQSGAQGGQRPATNNMLEGVQRLLQIFKNEPSGQQRPSSGGPNSFGPGGPGPMAPFVGGPGGMGDYPPEKRMRR